MKKLLDIIKAHKLPSIIIGVGIIVLIVLLIALFGFKKSGNTDSNTENSNYSKESSNSTNQGNLEEEKAEGDPYMYVTSDGNEISASDVSTAETNFVFGIDVSKYQGKIDWSAVKSSGIKFAIIRVGYRSEDKGRIVEDPYAAYNLQEATKAGIQVGVYFMSSAKTEAEATEEANWVTSYISPYSITYPVVYDCEGYNKTDNRMYGLSNAQRTSNAVAFINAVSVAGYEGMFYSNYNSINNNAEWNYQALANVGKMWVAAYTSNVSFDENSLGADGSFDMWQYTQRGTVPGIDGYVDLDVAYFGYNHNQNSKGGDAIAVDPKEAGVTFQSTSDQVTAKEETNLRSEPSTNGAVVATIYNGDMVTRTGIGDNGWSRVVYNGQTLYAKTSLLTTEVKETTTTQATSYGDISYNGKSYHFEANSDIVTPKDEVNLRSVPGSQEAETVVVKVANGERLQRIGICNTYGSWSAISYNGQILYAVTSYLETI